jgi:PncC family amidohydrolase
METLWRLGTQAGTLLKSRRETIVVAETSAGGLISAALLAVPGASAYFVGGAITYSARAISALAGITREDMRARGIRSSSEPYAELLATQIRARHPGVTWGLAETGAAGPTGNSYGDPAGHTCISLAGTTIISTRTLRTGQSDRLANMFAFAEATLTLLIESLESPG